jgi:uncharacterized protein YggU (UPF0235/DUF167 family)
MRVAVRVHPRAARSRVVWDGAVLSLWVTAPAVDGAANRAVLLAVAEWAGVRPAAVRLVAGERSRSKVVEVDASSLPHPS